MPVLRTALCIHCENLKPNAWPMYSEPDRAVFLPLAQLSSLVARLMTLGYQCLGPAVENGAIVMRELQSPDGLPRGLQAEQMPGRYRLTRGSAQSLLRLGQRAAGDQAADLRAAGIAVAGGAGRGRRAAIRSRAAGSARAGHHRRACLRSGGAGLAGCAFPACRPARRRITRNGASGCFWSRCSARSRRRRVFARPPATDRPRPLGYDIALAELADGFVAVAGSAKGATVLDELDLSPATPQQIDAARQQGQAAAAVPDTQPARRAICAMP